MTIRLLDLRLILRAVAALALLAVFALAPASVSPSGVAHAQSADPEPTIVNICDRTEQVRDAILAILRDVSDCAAVTDSDLNSVRYLYLYDEEIAALQAGDFQGLVNLAELDLGNNSLSELPDGVFEGLANLKGLWLDTRSLSELPDGVFDDLANLERLWLSGNSLSGLPDGVFDDLANLKRLWLDYNSLSELPEDVFDGLANLERLDLNDNSLSELPDGVFDGLSNLEWLDLTGTDLSELPDGVFDGLSDLRILYLRDNSLSELPDGVFDDLTNLEFLYLNDNSLTELPDGVFDGLSNLEYLYLNDNGLSELPDGVFDDLTNLKGLYLSGNPGAPFTLAVELDHQGGNTFVIRVAEGTPADIVVNLEAQGGTLSRSTVTIDGGSVTSDEITITPLGNVRLKSAHLSHYEFFPDIKIGLGEPLILAPALQTEPWTWTPTGTPTPGICDRTWDVQRAILYYLPDVSDCSEVTDSDLSTIRGHHHAFPDNYIFHGLGSPRTLKSGDFQGLSNVEWLQLSTAELVELPDGVFDGLSNLREMRMGGGDLGSDSVSTELAEDVFDGLSNLRVLRMGSNSFTELPEDVFDGLSNLELLSLGSNDLTELPEDLFDGLSNLEILGLSSNDLSELPDGVFEGLANLRSLNLAYNDLSELPEDVFDGLANLESLYLNDNSLSELPDGVFDDLSNLKGLALYDNSLSELPDGIFDGLDNLEGLGLNGNNLSELPDGIFDGLDNLEALSLAGNNLSELPDDLSNLKRLSLAGNNLSELPDDMFDGLPDLEILSLYDNDLSELPDGVFEGLPDLEKLYLYGNSLSELPDGIFNGLSKLNILALRDNPGAPFTIRAKLEQQGDAAFVVKVDEGAPFDIRVTLSAQGGTIAETVVTLEGGSLRSQPISVTRSGEGQTHVTISVESATFQGMVPALPYSTPTSGVQTGPGEPLVMWGEEGGNTAATAETVRLTVPASVQRNAEAAVTMSFGGLASDSDTSTTDYIFRADVVDADACEGGGIGFNRYMYQVDEDPEVRTGTISAACPPGDYTVEVSISSPGNVELASATADFTVAAPAEQQQPLSTDATLSSLTLGDAPYIIVGFASDTTSHDVNVANDVTQTTVTPTTNDNGATYAIKLSGVTHVDGVIPLAVGSNVITVEVTAEDGNTVKTYTITVTRAALSSTDATLSGLTLSGVDFGTFDSATTGYTASVANDVTQTTVTPATNDNEATYAIKLDDVADADGVIPLAVGSNVITIEVTAEDGNTAKTYTVTVTRAAPPLSTDATLSGLTLSDVTLAFASATTEYTASVANDVTQTTVTPTLSNDGAAYAIKLDGVADADGTVELSVGSNVITVEVTAQDGNTAKTYTVTVTRATPTVSGPAVAIGLSPSGSVAEGTEITVTMSFANLESDTDTSDTDYIFRADVVNADACEGGGMGKDRYMYKVDEDPEVRTGSISTSCAPGDYTVEVSISSPDAELASATADFTVATPAQQQPPPEPPASTDATLSNLALSNVDFGAFASSTTGYTASVANAVDETTVTPTVNNDGATYAIKLGGVADADGVIPLAVGRNAITIEVTAEDGNTVKTYTVTVTRAEAPAPPSTDATLRSLTLSDAPFAFASDTTSYDVNVANALDQTTVTATANDGGASYVVKLGDAVNEDGTVELSVGSNAVSVVVTAEDGKTIKTYTVTVTRADSPPPSSPEPVEPEEESTAERSAWLEQSPENKPFVGEWQHFTLRGNGLDKVDLSVNVIGFGGAPSSTGAVGYGTASPLPAAGEVCGSAYYSGYQMSVDRTFSLVGCREGTVIIELLDPGNDYALLQRYTVTVDTGP